MRALLLFAALCLSLFAGDGRIRWHGVFDRALEESRATGRPMLVLLVRRNCAPCSRMVAKAMGDERVVRWVKEHAVAVLVTEGVGDYPIEMLYTLEVPTLFLLTPQETFLRPPLRGERNAEEVLEWLNSGESVGR